MMSSASPDQHVALAQVRRGDDLGGGVGGGAAFWPGFPVRRAAQRVGLGLAAPSASASAKLAKSTVNQSQARWPGEGRGGPPRDGEQGSPNSAVVNTAANFHDEHDRVAGQVARVKFDGTASRQARR
jgi:hypothetical protein